MVMDRMSMSDMTAEISPGVLSTSQVEHLFETDAITCNEFPRPDIDGSAFDLSLGTRAWMIGEGQRPTTRELTKLKVRSKLIQLQTDESGERFFRFEKNSIYLVELDHYINLPNNVSGRASGKSSVGRLDVITRLLTDNSREYDTVEAGYSGPLHLLILPQTFPINVRPGASLNQLRLFSGPPHASIISRSLIGSFGTPFWYIEDGERDYKCWETLLFEYDKSATADPTQFDLTVDLADPNFDYVYKARTEAGLIDLTKPAGSHDPTQYFERKKIEVEGAAHSVVLEAGSFYIMKSKERLYIPSDVAVEIIAISERIGDIRIHYAGFAHPGFGRDNSKKHGTPLIFEVRATDMPTRLYDESLLARIQLFRMSAQTKIKPSKYEEQELKLSSVFNKWPGED
jgi:dCTP deaminase